MIGIQSCKIFKLPTRTANTYTPESYFNISDTANTANIKWSVYFNDPFLIALIDTALKNNRELQITMQEIEISKNEVKAKKGEYLPFAGINTNAGVDRSSQYTFNGMSEEDIKAHPNENPKYIGDFKLSGFLSWELDIWKKLRNSKNAAVQRYLASIDGKNFMITNLIAEIASAYYELIALDNQLAIIQQNIEIQQNALRLVKQQKDAARVSQLAVNRFEAQLLHTSNLQYEIKQRIVETENFITFLTGRFPIPVQRTSSNYFALMNDTIFSGIPSQLLQNRADIIQAEHELQAANLDIKVAKANFFPNIRISAEIGIQAFNPAVWFKPQSLLFGLFGDLVAPLINQNALRANYLSSRAKQVQAVLHYEQTILQSVLDVKNQLSGIENYSNSLQVKSKEVEILTQSINVADNLYKYARADYIEVLLTQREVLESKMELTEIKLKQLKAKVNIYKALGGGWK